jgi:hypothetical protein
VAGLSAPLALIGLFAVPALVLIYLLRQRHRRQLVSSLFLWQSLELRTAGGRQLRRLERSALLLLELLAVFLLVLAAARPWLPSRTSATVVAVVLDNSFSMLAGVTSTPRDRATAAIGRELAIWPVRQALWLRAGTTAEVLTESAGGAIPEEVSARWPCTAPAARLEEAIALALEVSGPRSRVLVVSDRPPEDPEALGGRVRWLAFGEPASNLAVVAAQRSPGEAGDHCLLEVANLARDGLERRFDLGVAPGPPSSIPLTIPAGSRQVVRFTLPPGAGSVACRLPDDALGIDNEIELPPPVRPLVRVANELGGLGAGPLLQQAVDASGLAVTARGQADLVLSDRSDRTPTGDEWVVQVLAEADGVPYVGPLVLQRSHPLCEGLDLRGLCGQPGAGASFPATRWSWPVTSPCSQTPRTARGAISCACAGVLIARPCS